MNFNYKVLLLWIMVIIIALGIFSWWYLKTYTSQSKNNSVDYFTLVKANPLFVQADSLRSQQKYSEAISLYQQGLGTAKSTGEKSVFDIAIGTTQSIIDPKEGIQHLVNVGNNISYPNISRAYAFQYAYQMYLGYRNPELLKPFFSEDELAKIDFSKPLSNDVIKSIHEKIYTLAQLPLTKVRLAYLTWNMTGGKDVESVNKYMMDFDVWIKNTENYQGMTALLPSTYLLAAYLSTNMKDAGIKATFGTPENLYEQAIAKAQIAHIESTYQFALLDYANYLFINGQVEKSLELLKTLTARPIDPMIKATVVLPDSNVKYSALVNASQINSSLKPLLSVIGFILK